MGQTISADPVPNVQLVPAIISPLANVNIAITKDGDRYIYQINEKCLTDYKLGVFIGQGRRAAIYEGIHKTTRQRVAIKFVPLKQTTVNINDPELTVTADDFNNEVQTLRRLSDTVTVHLIDARLCRFELAISPATPESKEDEEVDIDSDVPVDTVPVTMGVIILDRWDGSLAQYITRFSDEYLADRERIVKIVTDLIEQLHLELAVKNGNVTPHDLVVRLSGRQIDSIRMIDVKLVGTTSSSSREMTDQFHQALRLFESEQGLV